jgi:phosphoribosylglycinamide formyltransferase-1
MSQFRIAILASGSGTNAENIIRYFQNHRSISVALVLSNNPNAAVLQRAGSLNVRAVAFTREQFVSGDILYWLEQEKITHIVLAGFLWLVPVALTEAFRGRIINIHPALLPRHGGKGMYGLKVHQSVLASGDKETGITIHEVNSKYDEGKILHQARCVVSGSDTAELIAKRVHELEYKFYPTVIEKWILENQASTA